MVITEEHISLIKQIRQNTLDESKYLDKIPADIYSAFFDNTYTNSQYNSIRILLEFVFGKSFAEHEISWLLYEFKPSDEPQIWLADGTEIVLKSDDDYYAYLRKNYDYSI